MKRGIGISKIGTTLVTAMLLTAGMRAAEPVARDTPIAGRD